MAVWGVDALQLDPLDRDQLLASYARRQKWLAELQAMEIVRSLDRALGGEDAGKGRRGRPRRHRISASQMLAQTGKELH